MTEGEPLSSEIELAAAISHDLSPMAGEFAVTVTRSASEEPGEWIADHVRVRRYRVQLRLLLKAQRATEEAGLKASAVP